MKNGGIIFDRFDYNLTDSKNFAYKFEECENVNGYSTIYSKLYQEYYVISDEECNGNAKSFVPLIEKIIEEEEKEEEIGEEEIEEDKIEEEDEKTIEIKCELKKCKSCDNDSILTFLYFLLR